MTVLLLSVIILGLLAMFDQTQRAFRGSMTQTDVLEGGRALAEMIGRDVVEIAPSHAPDLVVNQNTRIRSTNFFAELSPGFNEPQLLGLPGTTFPGQPNTQDHRTNIVQRVFFLSRVNQDVVGTGYLVVRDPGAGKVGTLYRYSATNWPRFQMPNLSADFRAQCDLALLDAQNNRPVTNMNRLAEGVAHLHVRAYDPRGVLVNPDWPHPLQPLLRPNFGSFWMNLTPATRVPDQANVYFVGNAVPAEIELEIGIVEQQVLQRLKSINVAVAQGNYLSNQAARVHLFRQRIPIRNVDTTAY